MQESRLDRTLVRNFWQKRAASAQDPRSVTLSRRSQRMAAQSVALYQGWMLRKLELLGCSFERVADLGCGNGDWTVMLAARARTLYAVDGTAEFVEFCRKRLAALSAKVDAQVERAELGSIVLPGQYDLIVCGAVVQYLNEDEIDHVLAQCAHSMAPGGYFYLRTTVSRTDKTIFNNQDTFQEKYQAVYRSIDWYQERLARHGLEIRMTAVSARFVAEELGYQAAAKAKLPRGIVAEFAHAVLKTHEVLRRRRTTVWVCVASRRDLGRRFAFA